jgi:primosomal protein N' (replication factor Y)
VIVQTFVPDHEVIRHALRHDYGGHAERLLRSRQALGYPPFGRLALIRLSHPIAATVRDASRALGLALRASASRVTTPRQGLRLLGPAPAPMPRIGGRHRWHLLALAPDPRTLAALLDGATAAVDEARSISRMRVVIDIDPQSML